MISYVQNGLAYILKYPRRLLSIINIKTRMLNSNKIYRFHDPIYPFIHPSIHLSFKLLGKLGRPLHLGRSNSTTLAHRAIGDGLEGRSHSGTGADGELFTVGAADQAARGGAGG